MAVAEAAAGPPAPQHPLAIPGGDGVPTRVVLAFDEQPEGEGTRDEL